MKPRVLSLFFIFLVLISFCTNIRQLSAIPIEQGFDCWPSKDSYEIGETVFIFTKVPAAKLPMAMFLTVLKPDGSSVRVDLGSVQREIQSFGIGKVGYPLGQRTVELWGQYQGNWYSKAYCFFNVVQPPPSFDFTVSVDPSSRTIKQGESTTFSVWITLTWLTSSVKTVGLSLIGHHETMTYIFRPSSGSPNFGSLLTITTSTSTPVGSYTLTVTARDGGKTHSESVILVVERQPPSLSLSIANFWEGKETFWLFVDQWLGPGSYPTNVQIDVYVQPDIRDVDLSLEDAVVFAKWKPGQTPMLGQPPLEPGHFRFKVTSYAFVSRETAINIFFFTLFKTLERILPYAKAVELMGKAWFAVGIADAFLEKHAKLNGLELTYSDGSKYWLPKEEPRTLPNVRDAILDGAPRWAKSLMGQWVLASCPVDILVIDTQGRRVGAIYRNGLLTEEVNEIPGTIYLGRQSETKTAVIPRSSGFSISIQVVGTDDGKYLLSTGVVRQEQCEYSTVSEQIGKGSIHEYSVSLSSSNRLVLQRASWWGMYGRWVLGGALAIIAGGGIGVYTISRRRKRGPEILDVTSGPRIIEAISAPRIVEVVSAPRMLEVKEA